MQGPIYSGKLHDKEFVEEVLNLAESKEFKTKDKVKGVLLSILEEIEAPLSWNIGSLCKFFKVQTLSQKHLRSAIRDIGKEVSQSHTNPSLYKTNASVEEVFDIFKHWKKQRAPDRYFTNVPDDSASYRVLAKEVQSKCPNFGLELEEHEKNYLKQLRFPINEANWGPKPRPRREISEEKND